MQCQNIGGIDLLKDRAPLPSLNATPILITIGHFSAIEDDAPTDKQPQEKDGNGPQGTI
jgi:hypothetical protein